MNKSSITFQRVIDILIEASKQGSSVLNDVQDTTLDNKPFLIFSNHDQIDSLDARLNGYKSDISNVWLKEDESITDAIQVAKSKISQDPNNYYLKKQLKELTDLMLYRQYLAIEGIEDPVGIDDLYTEVEYGFDDEFTTCSSCGSAVRTSPDSYHWVAPLFLESEGYICDSCANSGDYDDQVLEQYANKARCLPKIYSPDRLGLEQVNSEQFENGLHEGMNDDPKKVIDLLQANNIDCWFKVYPSQFYCSFDVYVRSEDLPKARTLLIGADVEGINNVKQLSECLKQAVSIPQQEGCITYSKLNIEAGKVETRYITPEQFVKGIKD